MRSGYERAIGRPYTTRWPDPETVTETTNDTTPSRRGILTMKKSMLVAAVASLSLVNATFAWAQGAVQEPGVYGFYHPDGDVLHAGSGQYGSHAESHGAIGVHDAMAATTVGRHARGHRQGWTQ
jgi:hypothetical protein